MTFLKPQEKERNTAIISNKDIVVVHYSKGRNVCIYVTRSKIII